MAMGKPSMTVRQTRQHCPGIRAPADPRLQTPEISGKAASRAYKNREGVYCKAGKAPKPADQQTGDDGGFHQRQAATLLRQTLFA